jgi:hypothetical protein
MKYRYYYVISELFYNLKKKKTEKKERKQINKQFQKVQC